MAVTSGGKALENGKGYINASPTCSGVVIPLQADIQRSPAFLQWRDAPHSTSLRPATTEKADSGCSPQLLHGPHRAPAAGSGGGLADSAAWGSPKWPPGNGWVGDGKEKKKEKKEMKEKKKEKRREKE